MLTLIRIERNSGLIFQNLADGTTFLAKKNNPGYIVDRKQQKMSQDKKKEDFSDGNRMLLVIGKPCTIL